MSMKDLRGYLCGVCHKSFHNEYCMSTKDKFGKVRYYHTACYEKEYLKKRIKPPELEPEPEPKSFTAPKGAT